MQKGSVFCTWQTLAMGCDRYQTLKEVADCLNVGEATVRGWIKGHELRPTEIGKGWQTADSDLAMPLPRHATRLRAATAHKAGSGPEEETRGERGAPAKATAPKSR